MDGTAVRVCVGAFAGAHGVRGQVKLKSFTEDPAAIGTYRPLTDETGERVFQLQLVGIAKDGFLARVDGIHDRNAAEALQGTRIYAPRDALPPPDPDEFYHADLLGMAVEQLDGTPYGTVRAVHNFGAGDVLEIERNQGASIMLPFTQAVVPTLDFAGRRVVVNPPAEA